MFYQKMGGQKETKSKVSELLPHECSFKINATCGRRAFQVLIFFNSKVCINTQSCCLVFLSDGQSGTYMPT